MGNSVGVDTCATPPSLESFVGQPPELTPLGNRPAQLGARPAWYSDERLRVGCTCSEETPQFPTCLFVWRAAAQCTAFLPVKVGSLQFTPLEPADSIVVLSLSTHELDHVAFQALPRNILRDEPQLVALARHAQSVLDHRDLLCPALHSRLLPNSVENRCVTPRVYVWCGSAARALDRALTLSRALSFQRALEEHIDKVLRIYRAPNRYVSLSAAVRGFTDPNGSFVSRGVPVKRLMVNGDEALEQSPLVRACCGRNPLFLRSKPGSLRMKQKRTESSVHKSGGERECIDTDERMTTPSVASNCFPQPPSTSGLPDASGLPGTGGLRDNHPVSKREHSAHIHIPSPRFVSSDDHGLTKKPDVAPKTVTNTERASHEDRALKKMKPAFVPKLSLPTSGVYPLPEAQPSSARGEVNTAQGSANDLVNEQELSNNDKGSFAMSLASPASRDPHTGRRSESSSGSRVSEDAAAGVLSARRAKLPPLRSARVAATSGDFVVAAATERGGGDFSEEQLQIERLREFASQVSEVADGVFVSGYEVAKDRDLLKSKSISHIVNCARDVCDNHFPEDFEYFGLHLKDDKFEDIASWVHVVCERIQDALDRGGRVLIHCAKGVSRSCALAIGYLIVCRDKGFDDAYETVKSARDICAPNIGFTCQLKNLARRRSESKDAATDAVLDPLKTPPPLASPLRPRLYRLSCGVGVVCRESCRSTGGVVGVGVLAESCAVGELDCRGVFVVRTLPRTYVWIGARHRLTPSSPFLRQVAAVVARFRRFEPWFGFARDPVFALEKLSARDHDAGGGGGASLSPSSEIEVVKTLTELDAASSADIGVLCDALGLGGVSCSGFMGGGKPTTPAHRKYDAEYRQYSDDEVRSPKVIAEPNELTLGSGKQSSSSDERMSTASPRADDTDADTSDEESDSDSDGDGASSPRELGPAHTFRHPNPAMVLRADASSSRRRHTSPVFLVSFPELVVKDTTFDSDDLDEGGVSIVVEQVRADADAPPSYTFWVWFGEEWSEKNGPQVDETTPTARGEHRVGEAWEVLCMVVDGLKLGVAEAKFHCEESGVESDRFWDFF